MKKLLTIILPAFALLFVAAVPQAASARDGYSSSYSSMHRGDRDDDRGMWRGKGWHKKCRMVTVKHWDRRKHRMVYTQKRVCRR